MDRPPSDAPPTVAPDVLYVPSVVADPSRLDLGRIASRRHEVIIALLVAMVVGEGAAIAVTLPAFNSLSGVAGHQQDLEAWLLDLDRRSTQVDLILERLRQTEARLNDLGRARGAHGGPDLPEMSNEAIVGSLGPVTDDGVVDGSDGLLDEGPIDPSRLSPAGAWAVELSHRMADQLEKYHSGIPDLEQLIVELDSVSSVRDALPGIWPTQGEITSGFGWRTDPVHGSVRFHAGLDIANDRGTPIYAVAPGRVTRAATSTSYGRVIDIDHGLGISTRYGHCTTLRVKEGDIVERGDFISTMGSTGKSTGPHLHFELRVDDSAHDPLKYLPR